MNVLVVVNDQPYGSERPYNALRLANALSKRDDVTLRPRTHRRDAHRQRQALNARGADRLDAMGPQDTRVLTTGVRVSAPPARITQTRFAASAVWTAIK